MIYSSSLKWPINVFVNQLIRYIQDGPVDYSDYATFEADYLTAKIHPSELKPAVQAAINAILGMYNLHVRIYVDIYWD